jgi:uncharacterized membrane protein YdbT with pleckstrin-like domain
MSTSSPAARTYSPVAFAVTPGSAARGAVLGVVYMLLFPIYYFVVQEAAEGTAAEASLDVLPNTIGWGGLILLGLLMPIMLTLLRALLGYGRRSYEVGDEGITERRGILLRSKTFVSYDDLEGVSVTRSRVQSMYGAGTVRITDVNQDDEEQVMKMSYVRNPGDVATNVLRHVTDVTGSTDSRLDTSGIEELDVDSASISGTSADTLAAGTGGRYLMPTAVLHPRPEAAAIHGLVLGLAYGVLGAGVLYYFRDLVVSITGLENTLFLLATVALSAVAVAVAVAVSLYWAYDRTQYELYEDHITVVQGEKTTTFSTDDVMAVTLKDEGIASLKRGVWSVLALTDHGHIRLRDKQGDVVVEFAFIANPTAVYEALDDWLSSNELHSAGDPTVQERRDAPVDADNPVGATDSTGDGGE